MKDYFSYSFILDQLPSTPKNYVIFVMLEDSDNLMSERIVTDPTASK